MLARASLPLREQPTLFTNIYRVLLYAARAEIGPERLRDFLGLEGGGELELLGPAILREATPATGDAAAEGGERPGRAVTEVASPEHIF